MMKTFEIYFSDLNDDAQKRILEMVGVDSAADMNLDMNIILITIVNLKDDIDVTIVGLEDDIDE